MFYLKEYLKLKARYVPLHLIFIIAVACIYPQCLREVFYGGEYVIRNSYRNAAGGIVFLGPPIILFTSGTFLYKFVNVLLDYKFPETKTVVVRGLERPNIRGLQDVPLFNKDVAFSYWRTKDLNGQNKTLYISDVYMRETLHGETTRHWYKVTYYRFSKMVVSIEKAKGIKQKITKPGK